MSIIITVFLLLWQSLAYAWTSHELKSFDLLFKNILFAANHRYVKNNTVISWYFGHNIYILASSLSFIHSFVQLCEMKKVFFFHVKNMSKTSGVKQTASENFSIIIVHIIQKLWLICNFSLVSTSSYLFNNLFNWLGNLPLWVSSVMWNQWGRDGLKRVLKNPISVKNISQKTGRKVGVKLLLKESFASLLNI